MQQQKYQQFLALHQQEEAFVIPNPWDAGSAKLLTSMGFLALATTSSGFAFSVGKRDSFAALSREEVLANAQQIVTATHLPVSADLEDGFATDPTSCADTITAACAIGLVGGSIEDATGNTEQPLYDFELAVERVRAAAEAAKDRPFLLTARSENYLWGNPDLADTIRRLQAFSEAGADVLYAPALPDIDAIATVCKEVDKPVNIVMGLQNPSYSVAQLSAVGVKRISVGGSMARAALGALYRAAQEVSAQGTFDYAQQAIASSTIETLMSTEKTPR